MPGKACAAAASAGASISSTASAPSPTRPGTSAAAWLIDGSTIQLTVVIAGAGMVSITASAMNASVPSEPTMKPAEDLQRGIGVQQSRQRVAVGVADGELMAYSLSELLIGQQLRAQLQQPGGQVGLGGGERRLGARGGGVDDGPRGEHEGQRRHGVVGVALQGAAHAAGVVGDDPADRGHVGGGGVRPQPPPDAPQHGIGLTQDRSGASPQPGSAVLDHHAGPVPPDVDEDVVGLRLPVQARAAGAERGVPPGTGAVRQDRAHIVDGAGQDDDLRKVPVGTGVGGVADQVRNPVQHLVLAYQPDQVAREGGWGAFDAGGVDGIVLRRACGRPMACTWGVSIFRNDCQPSSYEAPDTSYRASGQSAGHRTRHTKPN